MTAQCLPFRQIPHSTRLFLDYLDHTPSVQQFYPRSARFLSWAADESTRVNYPAARRKRVAEILEHQNQSWGASAKTLENVARFRDGALAVVTGQQVGLFGGPVFSIYKALTAVKLAQEASKLGLNCIPMFWLATEDHDLDEVNRADILSPDGQLERFSVPTRGDKDLPVGGVTFGKEMAEIAASAAGLLGESEAATLLAECYRPGETFGTAFAKLFARLFADLGVILLDGSDPELDQIVAPRLSPSDRPSPRAKSEIAGARRAVTGRRLPPTGSPFTDLHAAASHARRLPHSTPRRCDGFVLHRRREVFETSNWLPLPIPRRKPSVPMCCCARWCRIISCRRSPTSAAPPRLHTSPKPRSCMKPFWEE